MAFERFTESGKGFRPRISIRPAGTIGVNDSALKKFGFSGSTHVALYFDGESRKIAIGKATQDEPGAQKLNFAGKGASISAKRFLDFHDIRVERTTAFECHYDQDQKLIVLDGEIKRRGRSSIE
jgi:hypothetical protein